ncbi:unnamed protein product [Protopolystoma xenopodis]|uniref:Uncharacterized protein n=1 Tax=Protopolystoma xenopodis TaxID=117903 RepID=A0A3S4ZUG3_9PLAT|nr:unnamed protein product [Protopolystoma xenopodis]
MAWFCSVLQRRQDQGRATACLALQQIHSTNSHRSLHCFFCSERESEFGAYFSSVSLLSGALRWADFD